MHRRFSTPTSNELFNNSTFFLCLSSRRKNKITTKFHDAWNIFTIFISIVCNCNNQLYGSSCNTFSLPCVDSICGQFSVYLRYLRFEKMWFYAKQYHSVFGVNLGVNKWIKFNQMNSLISKWIVASNELQTTNNIYFEFKRMTHAKMSSHCISLRFGLIALNEIFSFVRLKNCHFNATHLHTNAGK